MEIGLAGSAKGDAFNNTEELRPMKYNEEMTTNNTAKWEEAVEEEHRKFAKYKVWETVPKEDVYVNMDHEEETQWSIQSKIECKRI